MSSGQVNVVIILRDHRYLAAEMCTEYTVGHLIPVRRGVFVLELYILKGTHG